MIIIQQSDIDSLHISGLTLNLHMSLEFTYEKSSFILTFVRMPALITTTHTWLDFKEFFF